MLSAISARAIWPRSRPSLVQRSTAVELPSSAASLPANLSPTTDAQLDLDLQELNGALLALSQVFPDVRPEVFREMLSTFSEESRLYVVAEAMLQYRAKFVKGRVRLPAAGPAADKDAQISADGLVLARERFRSTSYKAAVKAAFYQEFRGLTHAAIKAVLAENNYSYLESRQTLADLTAKSWRSSIVNLFLRRRVATESPLVDWSDTEHGPLLLPTSSAELNEELEAALIIPIIQRKVQERLESDRLLAHELNDAEAEEAGATFDCGCCFTPASFESVTVCSQSGHYVCTRCIRATIKEAIYGQGWAKSIDIGRGTLRCIAPDTNGECTGCLPQSAVCHALDTDTSTAGLWQKVEDKIAMQSCSAIPDSLASCPFCAYAEIQIITPRTWADWGLRLIRCSMPYSLILVLSFLSIVYRPRDVPALIWAVTHAFALALVLLWLESPVYPYLSFTIPDPGTVVAPNRGRKFLCRNPRCQRASCLDCSAAWHDPHACHSSSRQSLRTYVEAAITDAVKRTCPKCNLSFVKSTGCNKLVCVCGYAMCYVCRAQIGAESYGHFCPHFRPAGGACGECVRCDLYKDEDEDAVVRRAKERAEREWWAESDDGRRLGGGTQREWEVQGVLHDMGRGRAGVPRMARTWLFG